MRVTIRVRFALLYGGLFLITGGVLLAITYLLVRHNLQRNSAPTQFGPFFVGKGTDPFQKEVARRAAAYQADTLNSLLTQGGIALGLVGVVAFGLGWLAAGRALRPVHQVTETARRVAQSHNLAERIAHNGPPDDIKELADTFDAMLARLARAFDSQRRFVANASHELRTPLTITRILVDVAVRRTDATDDVKRLGESLLAINAGHEQLIEGLLTLADSEQPVRDKTPLDLAEVTDRVLNQMAAEADEAGVNLHRTLHPAPTAGDPVLLERLAHNLIENAIRHNHEGGDLWATTRTAGDHAELVIANTGPTIPAYETTSLFEPFRRLTADRTRSDRGNGLGLSIVQAITNAHTGIVSAQPRDGGGLTITIELPIAQAHAAE